MYCTKCGKQIEDGSKFCEFCGASFTNDSQGAQGTQGVPSTPPYVPPPSNYGTTGSGSIGTNVPTEKSASKKMKYFLIAAAIIIFIIIVAVVGSNTSQDELAEQVQSTIVEKEKAKGLNIKVIDDLKLVHKGGNDYTGIMTVSLNGYEEVLNVKVTYDGTNFMAEWE